MPFEPYLAIAIFIAVFAIATLRNIHLGALMLPAACVVGVWLAGLSTPAVVSKFPVNILILVAGVTFFFGIAQGNGTIDRVVQKLLAAVGARRGLLPYVFYLITAGIASMGSSQAGYVMIPLAMPAARRSGVHPMVMAVALNSGMSTGGFAPTSVFGIVTAAAAKNSGIALNPLALLAVAMAANVALLVVATWLFPGSNPTPARRDADNEPAPTAASPGFALHHVVTLTCITVFILFVVISFTLPLIDYYLINLPLLDCDLSLIDCKKPTPDIGVIAFGFGALLALLYPNAGAEGIRRIDWSTAFMVGGIVTFVGVLQQLEAVDLMGKAAMNIGAPIVAAFVVCMIAGLASAFASTNAILAALVPLAVPLATSGGVTGWALLSAMGVCATIVDASPFSTTGALFVASAAEEERRSLKSSLTRWGLSMVLVGPAAAVLVLLLFGLA